MAHDNAMATREGSRHCHCNHEVHGNGMAFHGESWQCDGVCHEVHGNARRTMKVHEDAIPCHEYSWGCHGIAMVARGHAMA